MKCIFRDYFNECTRALVERYGGGWRQVVIGKNWPLIFRYMKKKFPQTWDQWYTFKSLQVLSEENLNWNLTRNPWKKEEEMVGFLGGKEYSSLVMYKEECLRQLRSLLTSHNQRHHVSFVFGTSWSWQESWCRLVVDCLKWSIVINGNGMSRVLKVLFWLELLGIFQIRQWS